MYYFLAIGQFKLELQYGNTQFGSKMTIFLSFVTLKFYGWTWKTIGSLFYATSSLVHHFVTICELKLGLQSENRCKIDDIFPCDLAVWQKTLKNNRTPLLSCFRLSSSFQSHRCMQIRVTVRTHQIQVTIGDFCPMWTPKLTDDYEKQ